MGIQTTVLEFIANQNHNNSSSSSSTSLVNNTTKDTQPIHESHSLNNNNMRLKKDFLTKNLYHGRKLQQNNEIIETKALKKRNCLLGI